MSIDIIDQLAGLHPDSGVGRVRHAREQARTQSQASYDALFADPDQTGVSPAERLAVATFVAGLHGPSTALTHYRERLATVTSSDLADLVAGLAAAAATRGPYGRFPETADLRAEDSLGPVLRLDPLDVAALGRRLGAAFEHAHLLVFRPREASPDALAALLESGWSRAEVVTLSQLVAYLTFQLRVIHGLSVLEAAR